MQAHGRPNKLLGLELVRFAAAFAVLVWHYQHLTHSESPTLFFREKQPFYSVLRPFYDHGFYGVHIFWCISGFIFFWKYRETISDRSIGGKQFFFLRFSRLYPLHFATLLLVALLQFIYLHTHRSFFVYQDNDALHFILQIFMASNWLWLANADPSFNGPIWSISVEVLVYALFFLVLRYLGTSLLVDFAIVVVCTAVQLVTSLQMFLLCVDFFYCGGLAAIASQGARATSRISSVKVIAASVLVFASLIAWRFQFYSRKDANTWFLLICTPALLVFASHDFRVNYAVKRFIEAIGNMTYSSYLVHFPIQLIIMIALTLMGLRLQFYSPYFFAAYLAVVLAVSHLVYRYFEAPVQDSIRRRFISPETPSQSR